MNSYTNSNEWKGEKPPIDYKAENEVLKREYLLQAQADIKRIHDLEEMLEEETDHADDISIKLMETEAQVRSLLGTVINRLDIITEMHPDEKFIHYDGLEDAILGVDEKSMVIIYSVTKIIEHFCKDMNYEDAVDWYEFNIASMYIGAKTPILCEDRA